MSQLRGKLSPGKWEGASDLAPALPGSPVPTAPANALEDVVSPGTLASGVVSRRLQGLQEILGLKSNLTLN